MTMIDVNEKIRFIGITFALIAMFVTSAGKALVNLNEEFLWSDFFEFLASTDKMTYIISMLIFAIGGLIAHSIFFKYK